MKQARTEYRAIGGDYIDTGEPAFPDDLGIGGILSAKLACGLTSKFDGGVVFTLRIGYYL
jgi:hypothetical protein